MKYDIHLFEQLNEEYRSKPIQTSFPQYDPDSQLKTARSRLAHLSTLVSLDGKRVLEIGCGRGYVCRLLASQYNCSVVGIDIREYAEWDGPKTGFAGLDYRMVDLARENPFAAESFDVVISYAVWEHIVHPFTILKECCEILKPLGAIYMYANQHCSAIASHLYRDIFFPFPHLLFDRDIIEEWLLKKGISRSGIPWSYHVNKLTYAHYKEYFRILGLCIEHERLVTRKIDTDFYNRFKDKLELYPKFDLELDFFEVLLSRHSARAEQNTVAELPSQLSAVRNSFSYRLGNMLVQAVVSPGRNTVLLPYRLLCLCGTEFKKRKTMGAKSPGTT